MLYSELLSPPLIVQSFAASRIPEAIGWESPGVPLGIDVLGYGDRQIPRLAIAFLKNNKDN